MNKLRIKKGDTVKVLSGKDKGKTGKVIQVHAERRTAVVENVNLHTRFEKSRKAGQPGKKVEFSASLPISKLQLIDPHSGRPSRIGFQKLDNGTKQRVAKESGKAI
jgi:large subunit ribosomal protein L24